MPERSPAYKQYPPYAVQVELAEGCSLACDFCGINAIRPGPGGYKFMTPDTADQVAAHLAEAVLDHGWNPRVEFAMHGEPTMNPDWHTLLDTFRRWLPKQSLMLTTNGTGLLKGNLGPAWHLDRALESVNVVAIDAYERYKVYEKIQARLPYQLPWYPDDPKLNPHRRRKPTERQAFFIRDISIAKDGTHATLFNHAGGAAPPSDALAGHRCAKPFREMAVRWDGKVALCCEDFRGGYVIGDLTQTPADTLWNHPRFQAARRRLYRGRRDFGACQGCTHRSYRPGLLPDPMGKKVMPPPRPQDDAIIAAALAEGPLTTVVRRPWEVA